MPIYYRPGGNNSNGGTNATTDAKQTLVGCFSAINLSDPDKRTITACADTPGGTATFTSPSGYCFFNNDANLFPVPTSEGQRLTFNVRVGDEIIFRPTSTGVGWFWKTKCSYITFQGMEFDFINGTSNDMFRWFTQTSTSFLHNIIQDIVFRNGSGHHCGAFSGHSRYCQLLDCESYDAGRVNTASNNYYLAGRDWVARGNISDRFNTPLSNSGGLRCYTNQADIADAGETENCVIERNFSAHSHGNFVCSGDNNLVKNNISLVPRSTHFQFIGQAAGSNSGTKHVNNTAYGQFASGVIGMYFSGAVAANAEIENNIFYGMTTPISLGSVTPTINTNNLTTDPSFVDEDGDTPEDFKLTAGSTTAIDEGTVRADVTNDYFGTTRATINDIGAHQYSVPGPTGLQVIDVETAPKLIWDHEEGVDKVRVFVEWGGNKRWWEAPNSETLGTQSDGSGRFNEIAESPIVLPATDLLFSIRQYDGETPLEDETGQIEWDNR